jgi:diacylglycerol O-acyltransferase / wax synthase
MHNPERACIDGGAGAALTNMIHDVTPVPRAAKPIPQAKVGKEPRDIAANFIDSYRQLWSQPFAALQAALAPPADPPGVASHEGSRP